MDFRKIKTLFIYLFLILNIMLACFYAYTVQKNKVEIVQEKELIEASMASDNIVVEQTNNTKENLGYINVTISSFKDENITDNNLKYSVVLSKDKYSVLKITANETITNIYNKDYKIELDNFITSKLPNINNYTFFEYDKENNSVVYAQTVDGIKIFDNKNARIVFKVESNGDIRELEKTAVTNIKKDKTEILATQTQVINEMYHEDLIPKNSTVKATLGYYTYISQVENQVLLPTWRVEITTEGNKKVYYVDAINTQVLGDKKNY